MKAIKIISVAVELLCSYIDLNISRATIGTQCTKYTHNFTKVPSVL